MTDRARCDQLLEDVARQAGTIAGLRWRLWFVGHLIAAGFPDLARSLTVDRDDDLVP